MRVKFDAPHQPDRSANTSSIIELLPGQGFDQALQDLSGFSHIWLIWWFHKNRHWRPKVLPPRGSLGKRGLFATRSPHRPNPIGITAVPLLSISGRTLVIGSNDLIDGTPILDIKPYIHTVDSFPNATIGWISEVEAELAAAPTFTVICSELATAQLQWLAARNISFFERAEKILSRYPSAHRTRRIVKWHDGRCRMGCGAWRLFFVVEGQKVLVQEILPGYPVPLLNKPGYNDIPDRSEQIDFYQKWPSAS